MSHVYAVTKGESFMSRLTEILERTGLDEWENNPDTKQLEADILAWVAEVIGEDAPKDIDWHNDKHPMKLHFESVNKIKAEQRKRAEL